jgi:hypothetical protein
MNRAVAVWSRCARYRALLAGGEAGAGTDGAGVGVGFICGAVLGGNGRAGGTVWVTGGDMSVLAAVFTSCRVLVNAMNITTAMNTAAAAQPHLALAEVEVSAGGTSL